MQPRPSPAVAPHAGVGLSTDEAGRRLAEVGPNVVRTTRERSLLARAGTALREPLVLVLLAAAVLTTVTGDVADTAVILLVVTVNTTVALWQEGSASRAVAALAAMTSPTTRVVRDGVEAQVDATELVPGDVVLLGEGDVVPADAVVLHGAGLGVDEAALTGESLTVDKGAGLGVPPSRPVEAVDHTVEAEHVLWAGTTVVRGRVTAQVVRTGAASAVGRIAALLDVTAVATPLQRRMQQLSRVLAAVAVGVCAVVLVIGVALGQPLQLMVLTGVSLVVAAVPESLPVVVTLSLALAARRMTRHQAVARSLAAVETLGSITLLATDKTGTLTAGRMQVDATWWPDGSSQARLLRGVALCNDARIADGTHLGDPTEVALLVAAEGHGIHRHELEQDLPRIAELPFDSDRKRMSTLHRAGEDRLLVCKGAPEQVLPRCEDPASVTVDAQRWAEQQARTGARVLAVAERLGPTDEADGLDESGLTLVGLIALHDPPRASAAGTVASVRDAGIRTVLITGDNALTATDLARRVGIDVERGVLDLSTWDGDLDELTEAGVLARATPAQKLTAVQAWQAAGHVVAMTGDGVNDAPAMRRADIGVAMGERGSDVAREAADLVLADDELRTTVAAVREGRRVYTNIRRFLLYGLSGGAAELLVMLGGPAIGLALPLLPGQILWVNLLTHSLAGTALGAEPADADALDRPPRDPREGVLGGGLWWRVLLLALGIAVLSLLAGALLLDEGDTAARSGVLLVVGAGQLGVALGARTARRAAGERNWPLPASVAGAALLLVAAVLFPPLQVLLSTAVPGPAGWWVAVVATGLGWLAARLATATPRAPRPEDGAPGVPEPVGGHGRTPSGSVP